jgi:hypothetical protein
MAQETAGCDLLAPTVGQGELRHPYDDRSIQIEHRLAGVPSGRQQHDRRRDERLGHRRKVEHRLGSDQVTGADVTDSESTRDDLSLTDHSNRQAGQVVRTDERLDQRPQAFVHARSKVGRSRSHVQTLRRPHMPPRGHATERAARPCRSSDVRPEAGRHPKVGRSRCSLRGCYEHRDLASQGARALSIDQPTQAYGRFREIVVRRRRP